MTKEERLKKEIERLQGMWDAEKELAGGARFVLGIDEAGRGPLCGPVVAACCLLPAGEEILWLNDSKKLSEKKREALYEEITQRATAFGIGIVGPERIDEINILQATFEAMREALKACLGMLKGQQLAGTLILVDGDKRIPALELPQKAVIGGDAKCPSISAASILAKVTRDHMMEEYDRLYPEYGFAKHKGYGTPQHIGAILKHGVLPIHRRSFLKKLLRENAD